MQKIAFVTAFLVAFTAPTLAQKARIEAVNAKWVELFNKGDFEGITQLYTVDAIAFPPGSAIVRGRAAIGTMWKDLAQQVGNPKFTTVEVKRLSPSAVREAPLVSFVANSTKATVSTARKAKMLGIERFIFILCSRLILNRKMSWFVPGNDGD